MKKLKTYRLRFLIMLALLAVVAVGYFTAGGIGNFCGIAAAGCRGGGIGRSGRIARRGLGQGILHGRQELALVERLDQEVMRACPHRLDRAVDRAVGGDGDDPGFRLERLDFLHHLQPVAVGQDEVKQHDHGSVHPELFQPFGGTGGDGDAVACGRKDRAVDHLERERVFDQQDRGAGRRGRRFHRAVP